MTSDTDELTTRNALGLLGDHGERRITERELMSLSGPEAAELERRILNALETTPGLEINTEDDWKTGDFIIRWRTRV